jgi:hypothetical protein
MDKDLILYGLLISCIFCTRELLDLLPETPRLITIRSATIFQNVFGWCTENFE